jgi:hypothetical protein
MTLTRIAAGAAVCGAVLFVSACGGTTPATGVPVSAPTTAGADGGPNYGAGGGARAFPGATGLLAQIDGTTLQVQSTDTQTAVTYSATTRFTNTVAVRLSDVVVGVCVQARSARLPSGPGGTVPTAAPATPTANTGPIAAASVEISPAVNGVCSALGGARTPGARPFGAPDDATPPAETPNPTRTRGPGAGGNGFGRSGFGGFGAFGKVTAVNGARFTVESSAAQGGSTTANAPISQTVDTSAATTYTRTVTANAKALVVGLCVTALGKASDTGSIAATSIALRPAENGSCSTGFGRRGPGGIPSPTNGGSGA